MKKLLVIILMIFAVGYAGYVSAQESIKPTEISEEATRPEIEKEIVEDVVASSNMEMKEEKLQETAIPIEGDENPVNK